MAIDINIERSAFLAARVYQTRLRFQAPVRTGALRDSISVVPRMTGDGFVFDTTFKTYGRYLDSGTGRYYRPNRRANWRPRPGKGKGGIKPRYWTNIRDEQVLKRITTILTKDVAKQIKQQLGKYK
jgi:hypothetical protein